MSKETSKVEVSGKEERVITQYLAAFTCKYTLFNGFFNNRGIRQ